MRIWYQSLFDGGRMPAYFDGYTHARPAADMIEHARKVHRRPPLGKKGA